MDVVFCQMHFLHQWIWSCDLSSLVCLHGGLHWLMFLNIELALDPWNKSQVVMVYDSFYRWLDSIGEYFVEDFYICNHEWYSSVYFLSVLSWAVLYNSGTNHPGSVHLWQVKGMFLHETVCFQTPNLSFQATHTSNQLLKFWVLATSSGLLEHLKELRQVQYLELQF